MMDIGRRVREATDRATTRATARATTRAAALLEAYNRRADAVLAAWERDLAAGPRPGARPAPGLRRRADLPTLVAQLERALAELDEDRRELRDHVAQEERQAREWGQRAELAVRNGQDELALHALVRLREHGARAAALARDLAYFDAAHAVYAEALAAPPRAAPPGPAER